MAMGFYWTRRAEKRQTRIPMSAPNPPNFFSERAGEAWTRLQDRTDAQIDPPGRAAMERLPLSPGQRVLDVGCGCGQTLLQLADRVGPSGRVLGVDISQPMLARARERAAARPEISLVEADAQSYRLPPASFDAVYSRFGVMFFEDPRAAFANLRAALRPGGHLAFVCWQEIDRNPWAAIPLAAVQRLQPSAQLPELLQPGRPGPFSFADPDHVRAILSDAGFTSIQLDRWEAPLHIGGAMTLAEARDYARQIGPAARAIAASPEEARPALEAALEQAHAPFVTDRGVLMDGACWLVTAKAP
jgi:ubiquinone/menaquinone biosynthesis C-methylase UbiE